MRVNLLIVAGLSVVLCSLLCSIGCKKAEQKPKLDPHSPEGVMLRLKEQSQLFNEAAGRKDFKYIHDYTYYFTGLAQALYGKLNDAQKERLRGSFDELLNLSNQLDHASGRRHAEATEASMQRIQLVLEEMDQQFREKKAGD